MRKIPFLQKFYKPILAGDKQYTARTVKYGSAGQRLMTEVGPIELISVERKTLGWIRDHLWRMEGVSSPQEFVDTWTELHGSFDSKEIVWLHHFRLWKGQTEVWI